MRKFLDTSNLITYQSGCYKGKIDWKSNIGKKLYFEYDDISGHIEILDYKRQNSSGHITIKYQDNINKIDKPTIHQKIDPYRALYELNQIKEMIKEEDFVKIRDKYKILL